MTFNLHEFVRVEILEYNLALGASDNCNKDLYPVKIVAIHKFFRALKRLRYA